MMADPKVGYAIDEAVNEAWAAAYADIRDLLEQLSATGEVGAAVANGYRVVFRAGYIGGYVSGRKDGST